MRLCSNLIYKAPANFLKSFTNCGKPATFYLVLHIYIYILLQTLIYIIVTNRCLFLIVRNLAMKT